MTEEATRRVVAVNRGDTTRTTVEFSDDHRVQTVLYAPTDDGTTYKPSMTVALIKVD